MRAFDPTIWARPAVDLGRSRQWQRVAERVLILLIGLALGFLAGLVAIG